MYHGALGSVDPIHMAFKVRIILTMRNLPGSVIALALAFVGVVACGPSHSGGDHDDSTATLTVDPPTTDLQITPTTPGQASFTATATYPNGDTRDVTAECVFSIDSAFGSMAQNALTMTSAGKSVVVASWAPPMVNLKQATATVIGHLSSVRVDPSLPANTPDLFGGTEDPNQAPTIVYPATGIEIPRNLGDFEAHWTDNFGHDVFELSLHTDFVDVRVYVPGANGEPAAGTMPTWASFVAAEWLAAVGDESSIQFRVRGVTTANPGTVGATTPQLVKLSNEAMEGGLYYWGIYHPEDPTNYESGVWRHDMAKPNDPAEQFMSRATEGGACVACHVLSRDGTKMAITYSGGNGTATLVDVATKAKQPVANRWNFGTFTPDGNEIIGSYAGALTLRNAADQSYIMDVPTGGYATHPDMSPDGTQLVFVRPRQASEDWHFGGGELYTMSYDQTTHTFGTPQLLVTDSGNLFYPSWSPDGAWVLYNRSDDDSTNGAYNNPSAQLYVVKADRSGGAIGLGTANLAGGLTNSWGRWAPFAQTTGANNQQMYWITVSSKRTFGVRRQLSENWPSIWMFAFFPDVATTGADPSSPAFRVPFQDFTSHNHIAQWAERVVVTQ